MTVQRVYQLRDAGKLGKLFEGGVARKAEVYGLPLLAKKKLSERGIAATTIKEAINKGLVVRRDKYSLDDLERLKRLQVDLDRGNGIVDIDVGLSGHRCDVKRYDFGAALAIYRRESLRPDDLPLWFWSQPSCPDFDPPTGVFLYVADTTVGNEGGQTFIWRSAGWSIGSNGEPRRELEGLHDDRRPGRTGMLVPGRFDVGTPLPQYETENAAYEAAKLAWGRVLRESAVVSCEDLIPIFHSNFRGNLKFSEGS